ncbi:MAG: tRNA lysidine(34) synthetase TilS, partial [Clostridiales bacterium]|nr:tRNA lysidine(34) synthetase TilS [Clostridiales bacterium]
MKDLIFLVEEYIEKNRLLSAGPLVAGVSGGADSMALLFVLKDICDRKYPDIRLSCAHVNHGIRKEADLDEKAVSDFCAKLGVPFHVAHIDIPAVAKEEGLSLETAGRIQRYAFFNEIAGENGIIAVAHHMEDQAESIAMHIFRGAGMEGLCGIRPKNGNVIHPFLCLRKEDILSFCKA